MAPLNVVSIGLFTTKAPTSGATGMDLPLAVVQDKTLLVAILIASRAARRELAVTTDAAVTRIARQAGIARTYAYQKLGRLLPVLEQLASTRPGRPPGDDDIATPSDVARELTIAVLRYQVAHPGSITVGSSGRRATYAAAFRRFILRRLDAWPSGQTLEAFAAAAELPLDTLRDWVKADKAGLTPPARTPRSFNVPRDASELTRRAAALFEAWQGSTREFTRVHAQPLGLRPGTLRRLLILIRAIDPPKPRTAPRPPRYRGETQRLSPGAMLVTDGKQVHVRLRASGRDLAINWQPMVDQATCCVAGSAIAADECAVAAGDAFESALAFMAGHRPEALLHDNKPIYADEQLADRVAPTTMIPATPGRAENKAVIEGLFGDFEQQVGSIQLDDSSTQALVRSAASEVLRAFAAACNHAGRAEYDGRSRAQFFREHVPSPEQIERNRRFLERLRADHTTRRRPRQLEESRRLLDLAFAKHHCLRGKDPRGSLRRTLAYCQPSAIRQALAVFATKLEQMAIDERYAHRYLAALVRNCQDEYELLRAERELLELARQQGQWWTAGIERELGELLDEDMTELGLACELASRAAHGGLPVEGAYWTEQLLAWLQGRPDLNQPVRAHLTRLFEAPFERRLNLLDQLAALEHGIR